MPKNQQEKNLVELNELINQLRINTYQESYYSSLYAQYQLERIRKERWKVAAIIQAIVLGVIFMTAILQSI